jgi:hypothetical protein
MNAHPLIFEGSTQSLHSAHQTPFAFQSTQPHAHSVTPVSIGSENACCADSLIANWLQPQTDTWHVVALFLAVLIRILQIGSD